MDFRYTEKEEAFRREVRDFLESERVNIDEIEKEHDDFQYAGLGPKNRAFQQRMGEKGWLAVTWPEEYGGRGGSAMERYILQDELTSHGVPGGGLGIVGPCLRLYGTDVQKQKYLPPLVRGEIHFALGYTEPEAGSDMASLQIQAVRDGDEYVVNGTKIFNTETHVAEYIWLAARTDPNAPKHRGISVFIVDAKTPGIRIHPLTINDGGRTNLVYYEDVRIPRENLVGEENRGWYYLTTALDFERAMPVGDIQRQFNVVYELAIQPRPDGTIPFDDPVVRQKLAQLRIEVQVCRLFSQRVAWMVSAEIIPNRESSMLKLFRSELQQRIANAGVQVAGLYGLLEEHSPHALLHGYLPRNWNTSIRKTIVAGTSEIQRNIIATRGLGLPR